MNKEYQGSSQGTKSLYEAPILTSEQMEKLIEQMEEFANAPREEYGKRQPGERGMYEIQRRENLRERLEQSTMDERVYGKIREEAW